MNVCWLFRFMQELDYAVCTVCLHYLHWVIKVPKTHDSNWKTFPEFFFIFQILILTHLPVYVTVTSVWWGSHQHVSRMCEQKGNLMLLIREPGSSGSWIDTIVLRSPAFYQETAAQTCWKSGGITLVCEDAWRPLVVQHIIWIQSGVFVVTSLFIMSLLLCKAIKFL